VASVEFVESDDGARLGVQLVESFDDTPVLVIPGGPCRDPSYLGSLAGLANVRSLAIMHPRGTAVTGGLSRGWWADAADLIAIADRLGLESFDVLAHSAGTRVALAVAAQHPNRVRSMALVTPPAAWLTSTAYDGASLAAQRTEPEIARAIASMAGPQPTDEDDFQKAFMVEAPGGYARWTEVEQRHSMIGAMSLAAARAWFTDIPADAARLIRESPMPPTFVLGGAHDILSGVEPVRAYARALGAELAFIERCGHYPWIEQPAAFHDMVGGWLRIAR
jgi:pimeloyl-ACP methyl ester carboxylesterase